MNQRTFEVEGGGAPAQPVLEIEGLVWRTARCGPSTP